MVLVVCCMDKREHSFLTFLTQEINRLVLLLEFRSITSLKLRPLCDIGVLTEPLVQFSARGNLLEPLVELSVFLSQITWRSDYLISEAALCQQLGLELIDNEKDGRIYTLPKAPLEKPVLPRGAPGAT